MFVFVNSSRFATRVNQMSCNREKTDGETKKSKRKCFFNKNVFDLKTSFSGVSFVEKHEGNKWRYKSFCFIFLISPELNTIKLVISYKTLFK